MREYKKLIAKLIAVSSFLVILIGGLTYASRLALSEQIPSSIENLVTSIVIVISSLVSVKLAHYIVTHLQEERKMLGEHQKEISYRFVQITVYISAAILIFQTWSINLSNILIGAGVLGILVGLAARQTLSSVLAGIVIMTTEMFRVGHWIKFGDKFGKVSKITFFNTHIHSPQSEQHIIPNDSLVSEEVTNLSFQNRYRNDLLISVDYDTNLDKAIEICDEELAKLQTNSKYDSIVGYQPTSIKEFEDSGIILSLKVFVKNPNPYRLNHSQTVVFKKIQQRFNEEDIDIPFPQVTISKRNQNQSNYKDSSNSEDETSL